MRFSAYPSWVRFFIGYILMKKFLICALCLLFAHNTFAQIHIDKVEEDGSRVIVSSSHNIYTGLTNAAAAALMYISLPEQDHEQFEISITLNEGKMQFDVGRKLLLKFSDDSVMELSNTKEIGIADYTYRVGNTGTDYYTNPTYLVSEEQLIKIISGEVVKIRIENNIEYFDRIIKKNKFSNAIKKSYDAIINKRQTKNDVYTNF